MENGTSAAEDSLGGGGRRAARQRVAGEIPVERRSESEQYRDTVGESLNPSVRGGGGRRTAAALPEENPAPGPNGAPPPPPHPLTPPSARPFFTTHTKSSSSRRCPAPGSKCGPPCCRTGRRTPSKGRSPSSRNGDTTRPLHEVLKRNERPPPPSPSTLVFTLSIVLYTVACFLVSFKFGRSIYAGYVTYRI